MFHMGNVQYWVMDEPVCSGVIHYSHCQQSPPDLLWCELNKDLPSPSLYSLGLGGESGDYSCLY